MLIGIDGNEANVKERVGSGQYAYELLKQFRSSSWRERPRPIGSDNKILSRSLPSSAAKGSRMTGGSNHQFIIYLKAKPLSDLPRETANFKYKVFGPKKLWTQFALPLKLTFGRKLDVFFSMGHYGPRFSKIPYVVAIHDLSYLHFPKMFKKNDLYQLVNWTKYSVKAAVHVIAVSETTKKDIIENYNIDPSKVTVTYEGYDKNRFKPQPRTKIDLIKKKYKIKEDYIIFVGTLQPRKNIEGLIEAFAKLIPNLTPGVSKGGAMHTPGVLPDNLQLVIAGKRGWLYDSIFQKVKDLGLDQKVLFTGYVPDYDLPALICGAKVYVLPSLWEGFGIPVIEAQACGVPVVVSNTSSLPEIVTFPAVIPALQLSFPRKSFDPELKTEGRESIQDKLAGIKNKDQILDQVENDNRVSAILVDPQSIDSIAAGIKKALDSNTKSELVKKGFANIKRFSWQTCAQQTLDVLEKVAMVSRPIV